MSTVRTLRLPRFPGNAILASMVLFVAGQAGAADSPCPSRTYPIDMDHTRWSSYADGAFVGHGMRWPRADGAPVDLSEGWSLLQEIVPAAPTIDPEWLGILTLGSVPKWTAYPDDGCATYARPLRWADPDSIAAALADRQRQASLDCAASLVIDGMGRRTDAEMICAMAGGAALRRVIDPSLPVVLTDETWWCSAWTTQCAAPNAANAVRLRTVLGIATAAAPDPANLPALTGWTEIVAGSTP